MDNLGIIGISRKVNRTNAQHTTRQRFKKQIPTE